MRTTALTLESLAPRDVMAALSALGIDARERGDEAVALCPNPDHHDTKPSWSCNLDDGRHHCFACGYGGTFVYLVSCMLGLARGDAGQWVRERKVRDVAGGFVAREPAPAPRAEVSEADMWRFTDPPAGALESRGLSLEACRKYDVRWDNDRSLWVTPVRDPFTGQLWGWQEKNDRIFNNRPRDLRKSHTLFGYREVPPDGVVLLVESPLDVPYAHGLLGDGIFPVSSYGVSVSRQQISLLCERASAIILALDDDAAGWRGVSKLAFAFGTTPVRVFSYAEPDSDGAAVWSVAEPSGRDPGNLSAAELSWGIEHAIPNWRLRIPWLT